MGNIDPLYLLDGLVPLAVSVFLVFLWRMRRGFKWITLLYALIAYGGAIAMKYAIQIPTISSVINLYGNPSIELAIYYGLQTSVLEVGGAYLVARYAFSRGDLDRTDCKSYGISLSFWENGILLGLLTFISLLTDYIILGSGGSLSRIVYRSLMDYSPALFYSPSRAWFPVLLSVMERISSMQAHIAWGILTLLSASTGKKPYLYVALPMGMIDALVPYSSIIGVVYFEVLVFLISTAFLLIALILEARYMDQSRRIEPAHN